MTPSLIHNQINMFKKLLSIIGVAAMLATVSRAQTNSPDGNFFSSVTGYFTAFNTNLEADVFAARGQLWTGADSLQGNGTVPLANSLGLSYNVYQPATSPVRIGFESVTRNSGVAGTIVSEQIGPNLKLIIHDVTLTIAADPFYDFAVQDTKNAKGKTVHASRIGAEVDLRLQKQLTSHTFAGTGIGVQLPKNRQIFQVFAGFSF